jgi:hypothetical protein
VTLGIDDDCVLVSRSAFLENRNSNQGAEAEQFSDNVFIQDIAEISKSQILSITLIWRQDSFDKVEDTKHRLSFLLGVLERK